MTNNKLKLIEWQTGDLAIFGSLAILFNLREKNSKK